MNYKVCLTTKINSSKIKKGSGILVVEPDDYKDLEIKELKAKGYKVLAYLSVGTIERERISKRFNCLLYFILILI